MVAPYHTPQSQPMTPTDRARMLFNKARCSRTVEDVARLCECTNEEAQKAISDLHAQGDIRRTGTRSYIPSTVQLRHFADGSGRRVTDHEADTAAILAVLPERTAVIASHVERSIGHVIMLLKRAGAAPGASGMWYPPGAVVPKSPTKEAPSDPKPGDGGILAGGADSATWMELAPTKEGFDCERRGRFVTRAQCYDDYLDAECKLKGAPTECRGCPRGQRQRAEYAQGA